ncbi:low-density lipoprotein receptor class A domain-containing protein 1 isoform X2 [Catharus ustulatus]|uniref:low-density lipoprotein receptor class A domain-containing protein 1 isoform X2 n=1 Tax=Catharus ustulatus TaxID=91951 RepID=UPI0014091E1D|nr:low-density lipoprotein receptor class A domain-containing protein 1 isoform X2 [Catharus ustulatus]
MLETERMGVCCWLSQGAGAGLSTALPVPSCLCRALLALLPLLGLYPGNISVLRELPAVPGALGSMNKTHPQRNGDVATGSTASFSGDRGCCHPCGAHTGCTQRPLCISAVALLVLVAALASGLALALLLRTPVNRLCTAPNNKTGFLCDDRVTCVPASQVCDNISNCRNGEDEQEQLCVAACPPCGQEWWSCSPVHYEFCSCIPRRLCRDGIQHCLGWSDELLCTA